MGFRNRGDFPSIGGGGNENGNHFHINYYGMYCYSMPLDKSYVIIQIIVTFIILIVGAISFITTYKSDIIDPIENMKKLFTNVYMIIIAIFLVITFLINYLSKNEVILIKRLIAFSIISIITMTIFFGIKLNFDVTYTKDKFEMFYSEQNVEDNSKNKGTSKQKLSIGMAGVGLKTEKEYYVAECLKLYRIFKIKTYCILSLHLLLNILLIYQVLKVSKIQGKKEKVNKDDAILFDEEQNVKM